MRRYGFLQTIYLSFYSKSLYQDVAKNWGGSVIFYLFLVSLICWGAMAFKWQPIATQRVQHFSDKILVQVPNMKISQGEVETPEKKPYKIMDPDTQEVVAIIDTTGKYNTLTETPKNTVILVTKNKVLIQKDEAHVQTQTIPTTLTMAVVPEEIQQQASRFSGWLWVIFVPFFALFEIIYRSVQSCLYAIFGRIYAACTKTRVTYGEVIRLTMVALTPVMIIGTLFDCLGLRFPFMLLFYFLLGIGYMIFAIKANR